MEYSCHAFHNDLPKGKSSGHVQLDSTGFIFTIAKQVMRVPFHGCQLELGGAGDRILFISHPLVKGWTFYCSDKRLLSDPQLRDHPELVAQISKVRRKGMLTFAVVALTALVIIGLPALLLLNMDWLTAKVARQIPVEWENTLGETAIAQYTYGVELLDEEKTAEYLDPLVQPLLSSLSDSRFDYNFYIALDPTENAFALPGGYVVIHSQLILTAGSAEELLGVLAHEIMHVEQQHGVRNVIGTAGVYTLVSALFGDVSGILAIVVDAAPFLLSQSYSRGFEREADRRGFDLLVSANINPRGLASFFEKLIEKERTATTENGGDQAGQSAERALQFLSTHPASEERVQYLSDLAREHEGDYRDLSDEFQALRQVVEAFAEESQ